MLTSWSDGPSRVWRWHCICSLQDERLCSNVKMKSKVDCDRNIAVAYRLTRRSPHHGRRNDAMLVKEVMTHNAEVVTPDDTLEQAAKKMGELNIGPLPVCEGNRVVGILTDRDITVRATAAGCDPKTTLVSEAMSHDVICCHEDQDVSEAAAIMKEKQIRRLLVMNH